MDLLSLPLLILILLLPESTPGQLADFSRFARVKGEEVAVVDMFGAERLGRVIAATDTTVTLGFGTGSHTFDRVDVLKADRLRDGTRDGLIRGMAIGALVGWAVTREGGVAGGFAASVGVYGGLGFFFDYTNTDRAPLYRPKP